MEIKQSNTEKLFPDVQMHTRSDPKKIHCATLRNQGNNVNYKQAPPPSYRPHHNIRCQSDAGQETETTSEAVPHKILTRSMKYSATARCRALISFDFQSSRIFSRILSTCLCNSRAFSYFSKSFIPWRTTRHKNLLCLLPANTNST